jgi:hypothetical protein
MMPLQVKFLHVFPYWDEAITIFPPDIMLIAKIYPVYKVIENSKDWKLVYETDMNGVFVPADKVKQNYILPPDDMDYYKKSLFDTLIKFK